MTATVFVGLLAIPATVFAEDQAVTQQAAPTIRYRVVDLGAVGSAPAQPYVITNNGLTAGGTVVEDGSVHAVLWYKAQRAGIGATGFGGGPNSVAFGANEKNEAVGPAQTSDPNNEDFCGFNAYGLLASNTTCRPFLWRKGSISLLPTLGGANGAANMINGRGEVVGVAETGAQEGDCPVTQFKPVIWRDGKAHALPTIEGDPDGVAAWINEKGDAAGSSGVCAGFNPNSGLYLTENHAVMWQAGKAIDLGNLGGTGANAGHHACAINNKNQIVGHSELAGDTSFHSFLWTKESLMQDLGTLSGDAASVALGINDDGTVVGASLDADFNPRAYVWENGIITDLNTLVRGSGMLFLLLAQSINERGEIVGFGATGSGELHGFLAIPIHGGTDEHSSQLPRPALSKSTRQLLAQLARHAHLGN